MLSLSWDLSAAKATGYAVTAPTEAATVDSCTYPEFAADFDGLEDHPSSSEEPLGQLERLDQQLREGNISPTHSKGTHWRTRMQSNHVIQDRNQVQAFRATESALDGRPGRDRQLQLFHRDLFELQHQYLQIRKQPHAARRQLQQQVTHIEQLICQHRAAEVQLAAAAALGSQLERTEGTMQRGQRLCQLDCYSQLQPSSFELRSADYLRTKKKTAADSELFELIGVDCFKSDLCCVTRAAQMHDSVFMKTQRNA